MKPAAHLTPASLTPQIEKLFSLAAQKTMALDRRWRTRDGAPVFTATGKYTARGWTQWTQGFQYGNALIAYDVTGDADLFNVGLQHTVNDMPEHLTHMGVHDHGFNTLSTYGQLYRLFREKRLPPDRVKVDRILADVWERRFLELALKVSGAVQASRWTTLPDGPASEPMGYIYSFNGPHSLFIDTIRTVRICAVAHLLGHTLLGEQDRAINLLERAIIHARTSARFNVFFGAGRDAFDTPATRGRTCHEALFNVTSGAFRAPSTQQGYSPFSTWTRGLAWAILGFAEELELIQALPADAFGATFPRAETIAMLEETARATADFYIENATAADGICYWDTGAPGLDNIGDWRHTPADPFNSYEPVDSSASAIAAQGLIRLGRTLGAAGTRYFTCGLAVASVLMNAPYLSTSPDHEGILLHSIYHRPNGWDYVPPGAKIARGESCMWGDYHLLELGLLIHRMAQGGYYTFFDAALMPKT